MNCSVNETHLKYIAENLEKDQCYINRKKLWFPNHNILSGNETTINQPLQINILHYTCKSYQAFHID